MATEKVTQRIVSDSGTLQDTVKIKTTPIGSKPLFGSSTFVLNTANQNLFAETPDSFNLAVPKVDVKHVNLFGGNVFTKPTPTLDTEKLTPLSSDRFVGQNPVKKEKDIKQILLMRLSKAFKRPNATRQLASEEDIKTAVASNPRIEQILYEAGVPFIINYKNLETIKEGHINDTVEYSRAIAQKMGLSKEEVQTLETAAAFHDIGKSLIPAEYLNKNGALSKDERRIVNLHAVLGYELMKSLGYKPEIAEAVRDHHNPNSKNKLSQILRMADIYSAMTEVRPYKPARSHDEALSVLKKCGLPDDVLKAGEIVLQNAHDELHGG